MKCPICDKKFAPKRKKKTKSGKRFCSHKCQVKYFKEKWNKAGIEAIKNRPKLTKQCLNCSKIFITYLSILKTKKFCSRLCKNEFWKNSNQGKGKNCHFFIHGKGRLHYKKDGYILNWDEISFAIKQRDNFTCQFCGKRGGRLHVHHKDLDKQNNKEINLETLCPKCHTKWHWENGKNYHEKEYVKVNF